MKNTITGWLVGLAILMGGLVLVSCDKLSSITKAPEVNPKVEVKLATLPPTTASTEAFISEKGNFKITLPPGFPPFTVTEGNSEDPGDIALIYLSEKHGQDICMVMVNSNVSWDGMDPKTVLDAARDGGVNSNNGNTLEREMDLRLNGYPGRRIYIQQKNASATYFIRDDIVLVKTRLYQIMYGSSNKADLNTPKVLAYFNSFKLLAMPEADVVKESPKPVKKRQLEFMLPSNWIVESNQPKKDGSTTTLMNFGKESDIRGLYVRSDEEAGDAKIEKLISDFMEGVKNTDGGGVWDNLEILESTKTGWGGVRCDCRTKMVKNDSVYYWTNVFIVLDGNFHAISIATLDDNLVEYQPEIDEFLDSIIVQ
jgi:hypothetical protein